MHARAPRRVCPGPPRGESSRWLASPPPPARPKPALPAGSPAQPAAALPFMVTEETHRQPGSYAPPRKFALNSRSLRAHGSRAARRPSALQPSLFASAAGPRSPLGALCRGAAARAAHPGREAPLPPAPLPLARRGARAAAPTPPRALPRPPRPRARARPCPVALSPSLSSTRCLARGLPLPRRTRGGTKSEESASRAVKCSPLVCAKGAVAGLVSRPRTI